MFVLPALILPLVFGLAIYRLYQIPRRLSSGALRLPARRRSTWLLAGALAYFGLLACTVFLGFALVHLLFVEGDRLPAYLSLLAYLAAYPFAYVAAAWVFYYALVPASRADA